MQIRFLISGVNSASELMHIKHIKWSEKLIN